MEQLEFANLHFKGLTKANVLEVGPDLKQIITVNAEFIVHANNDSRFKKLICDNVATFDGQIPLLIARKMNRNILIEKISGSDLIYDICATAQKNGDSVFLLGGHKDSNESAVIKLRKQYIGLKINGFSPDFSPYPFNVELNHQIMNELTKYNPKYLFVGFGAKKQEFWCDDHRDELYQIGVRMCIGTGGVFEMVSGKFKRAPKLIQKLGLEGLYRFIKEPNWTRFKRLIICLRFFKYI